MNQDHLFADSFSGYASVLNAIARGIYTTQLIGAPGGFGPGGCTQTLGAYGRGGRNALRVFISHSYSGIGFNNSLTKTMPAVDDTCIFSFAFRYSQAQAVIDLPFFHILDNADTQVALFLNRNGTISVYCGNFAHTPSPVLLGTTTFAFSAGQIIVINGRIKIHPSAGTVDLWFNGDPTPDPGTSLTGVQTQATANPVWNAFGLGPPVTYNAMNSYDPSYDVPGRFWYADCEYTF